MSVSRDIVNTIDRLPRGYVFTYGDFDADVRKKEAVIKALNRMAAAGKIAKLSKGRFYKPESTPFGELQPDRRQIVKDLLEENGKITGYLTGLSSQPSMACGPFMADISAGMVMNGPTPIMFVMFSAVAWSRPKRRSKCGSSVGCDMRVGIFARPVESGKARRGRGHARQFRQWPAT